MKIAITIEVDNCIAKEIEELNNNHKIETIFSCCGHKNPNDGYRYILVEDYNIKKMARLGYEIQSGGWRIWQNFYFPEEVEKMAGLPRVHTTKFASFAPKSKCRCNKKQINSWLKRERGEK